MDTSKALNKVLAVKGWTQADLARACGWDPSYVSQLAIGHRDAGAETTRKIADATGVPPFLFALLGADPDDLRPGLNPDVAEVLADGLLELVMARNEDGHRGGKATIDDLVATLRAEANADAYAGDAAEMIENGSTNLEDYWGILGGPLEVMKCVDSELNACLDGTGLEGEDEADDLDSIADGCVRGARLLLHAAIEARTRAASVRNPPPPPKPAVDPRQTSLFPEGEDG